MVKKNDYSENIVQKKIIQKYHVKRSRERSTLRGCNQWFTHGPRESPSQQSHKNQGVHKLTHALLSNLSKAQYNRAHYNFSIWSKM